MRKTRGTLLAHISNELGKEEAKNICEDLAMVLANHSLVQSQSVQQVHIHWFQEPSVGIVGVRVKE